MKTYDAKNNLTIDLSQTWDTTIKAFTSADKHSYTYDANNNELTDLWQKWNKKNNAFIFYYYLLTTVLTNFCSFILYLF